MLRVLRAGQHPLRLSMNRDQSRVTTSVDVLQFGYSR